jgi:transcriptional regulator with XRE-family HTH domain
MQPRRRLARNVRRLRVGAGLSQLAVAADAKMQMTQVSLIEQAAANPTLDVLVRLSRALGADISALFEAVDARAPMPANLKRGRKAKPKRAVARRS